MFKYGKRWIYISSVHPCLPLFVFQLLQLTIVLENDSGECCYIGIAYMFKTIYILYGKD